MSLTQKRDMDMTALKITVLRRIIDTDYDLLYVQRKFHSGQLIFQIPKTRLMELVHPQN